MSSSASTVMSTPIALVNPATITLAALALLIIPMFLLQPGPMLKWLEKKKHVYEVTVPLYMMTPTERFIFSTSVALLACIL
jgi:serine palmitoyltransferase small subunit-like protein